MSCDSIPAERMPCADSCLHVSAVPLFAVTALTLSYFAMQVALFDRIHNIRVKHIQEEYQKYMERVRSKAQSAIDQANANYQHHRAMLTARVDAMVHYLQQQYLRVSLATIHWMLQSDMLLGSQYLASPLVTC